MSKITDAMINELILAVGGLNNIISCKSCMTRLRLVLVEPNLVKLPQLNRMPMVLRVIELDGLLQIVLGQKNIAFVHEQISKQLVGNTSLGNGRSLQEMVRLQHQNVTLKKNSALQSFLTTFATIFTPLFPGFIAVGLLLGLAVIIEQTQVIGIVTPNPYWSDLVAYLRVFSKGLFTFLGVLIGYNAQSAFGGSGVNGAIIATLFVLGYDPSAVVDLPSGLAPFLGETFEQRGNFIGILVATIFGAWVERNIRKWMPDKVDTLLTSTLTLLIVGACTYLVIMPLTVLIFHGMSWLFSNLNNTPLGCGFLSGLFLLAVMLGFNKGFIPIYMMLMEEHGFNTLFPILAMAGAGQVGAAIALYVRAEYGSQVRILIRGAIIPSLLGIGEPMIYGVMLPRLRPFITGCLGGVLGGFFIGLMTYLGVPMGLNAAFGPSGLLATPMMTSNAGVVLGMSIYAMGLIVAYASGFILTWYYGMKDVDLR